GTSSFQEMKERFNVVGVGLFDYPVLMASDILLYDTNCVPVGDDQIQHLELTRTLARRFNKRFGEIFVIPETRVLKEGSRIMGLDDAHKKMSKSAPSEYNYIALHDNLEMVEKKIMKAKTDSRSDITYSEDRPELKNLITIFALLENVSFEEIVFRYKGKGYVEFKKGLALTVCTFLENFQKKYATISDEEVREVLYRGAEYASKIAQEKMKNVRKQLGFWQ
ncbi:MAG: tryptophan--tRNA ligase, partial [Candidatus Moranbacteria bacterium]|nr:tryptophan--tRNA ligase [Candidatus Moranbacteria bacterium]